MNYPCYSRGEIGCRLLRDGNQNVMYTYTIVVDNPPRWERACRRYRIDSVVLPAADKLHDHGGVSVGAHGYHAVSWPLTLLHLCEQVLSAPKGCVEIVCCDVDTALPYSLFVSDVVITSPEPPPGPPLALSVTHTVTRRPAHFTYTVPSSICASNGHSVLWRQFHSREYNRSVKITGPRESGARIALDRGVICTPTGTGIRQALTAYAVMSQRRTVVLTNTPDAWRPFRNMFVHLNVPVRPTDRVIVENSLSAELSTVAFFTWFLSDSTQCAGRLAADIVSTSVMDDLVCTGRAYHRMCCDAAIVRVHAAATRRIPACTHWNAWPVEFGPAPSFVTGRDMATDESSQVLKLRPQPCACGELGCLQQGTTMTCLWCGTDSHHGVDIASLRDISFDGMLLGAVLIALARRGALHIVVWGPNEMRESLRPCLNRHHQRLRTPECQREHGERQVITWYDTESSTHPTPRDHDCVVVCYPNRATVPIMHDEQVCRSIRACDGNWHLVSTCT